MKTDEMEETKDKKHATTIETAAGKMLRQVSLRQGEKTVQPSSLFGHARGRQKSSVSFRPSRYDKQIPEPNRVKRDLDFNEPLVSPLILNHLSSDDDSHTATRCSTTPTSLGPTQDVDYSQCSTVSELPALAQDILVLEVIYGRDKVLHLQVNEMSDFSIGR